VEVSLRCNFVSWRRIAALSVAITLFAAPIASAQTPSPASTSDAPANTALLSPAAFSRLVHAPQPDVAPVPVVADAPRPILLRHGTAAMALEARATAAKAPQQKSWASRHKVITGVIIGVTAFFGAILICQFVCPE
jgi:hypothetical protein